MKRITLAMMLLLAAISVQAQGSIQLTDGTGNITILDGATSGGIKHYTFSGTGGQIMTLTGPSTLTINGNSFSWPDPGVGYLYNDGNGGLSWESGPVGGGGNGIGANYLVGHTSSVANGSINYACPSGIQPAAGTLQEDNMTVTMPYAGKVTGLHVEFTVAPDNGVGTQWYEISVRNLTQNTTSAPVTISETDFVGLDSALNLPFAVGDQLTIKFEPLNTPTHNNPKNPGEVSFGTRVMVSSDLLNGNSYTGTGTSGHLTRWSGSSSFDTSIVQDNGTNVGIGVAPGNVKLAVGGALAYITGDSVSLIGPSAGDSLTLSVGNRSYIRITSDDAPSDQALGITAGAVPGQTLILQCITNNANGFRVIDNTGTKHSGVNLNGTRSLNNNDILMLLWDGTHWEETGFIQNDKEF